MTNNEESAPSDGARGRPVAIVISALVVGIAIGLLVGYSGRGTGEAPGEGRSLGAGVPVNISVAVHPQLPDTWIVTVTFPDPAGEGYVNIEYATLTTGESASQWKESLRDPPRRFYTNRPTLVFQLERHPDFNAATTIEISATWGLSEVKKENRGLLTMSPR